MTVESGVDNESLLPPEVETPAIPVRLDKLAPWHRPRKHFVRKAQWARYAVDLVRGVIAPSGDRKIKYLTLPGLDYFDVEVIGEATNALGVSIELTAFQNQATNPAIQARCHIRTESLVKRGLIQDTADTLPYSIEDIISGSSQAARAIRRRGPFDVVNIDACGALAHPTKEPKLIHVLHKIVEYQQNSSRRRWLLFVTFDARRENMSDDILQQLSQTLRTNLDSSLAFSEKFAQLAQELTWVSERSMYEDELSRDAFLRQVSLALSKWLIHLGEEADWDVSSKGHYCYSTEGLDPALPTMGCLAFEFIPRHVPLQDPAAIGIPAEARVARPDYHLKAAEKVANLVNLDARMQEQEALKQELANEQLALLELAGYAPEALDEYMATHCA